MERLADLDFESHVEEVAGSSACVIALALGEPVIAKLAELKERGFG